MTLPYRLAPLVLLLCVGACQRGPDTDTAADTTTTPPPAPASPEPAAPAPATPVPATGASYACADGTALQASFGDHDATLQWPDGRSLVLPRAESASKGGGDVYVGETVSLQRDGARLQLHDGDRAATTCEPAPAGTTPVAADDAAVPADGVAIAAAARYACDADTILTRKDDGSFRAEVPGNPPVRLTRIAGSNPPVYTGASLYLRIGAGDAILSQSDRANELRCIAG